MWSIPFVSDRFGRKYGLYLILFALTLVSFPSKSLGGDDSDGRLSFLRLWQKTGLSFLPLVFSPGLAPASCNLESPFTSERWRKSFEYNSTSKSDGLAVPLRFVARFYRCTPSFSVLASLRASQTRRFSPIANKSAAIALKIVADMEPGKFRNAFYSEFVFVGMFLPMIVFLPESPCTWSPTWRCVIRVMIDIQGSMLASTNRNKRRRV